MRLQPERRAGTTNEGDALAVGRPRRARVVIDARREELHRARAHVVDANQRVIDAVTDERELRPVGRPHRRTVRPPRLHERLRAAARRSRRARLAFRDSVRVDLAVLRVRDRLTVRRQRRRRSLAELPRAAARRERGPDGALRARRVGGRVRHPPFAVRLCAPHERHHAAIVGNADVAQLNAVVFRHRRQPDGREVGRDRGVDIAQPVLVRGPRDPIRFLRRRDLDRRARREELFDRRARRCRLRGAMQAHCNGNDDDERCDRETRCALQGSS